MMRVLRLTRHPAGEEQRAELCRIFGADCVIIDHSETVSGVERIAELVQEHQADVLEAVLPLPLMAQAVNPRAGVGVPVIRAITQRVIAEDGSASFPFQHYEKVLKVEVQTERM
jgi:hypothetical protein